MSTETVSELLIILQRLDWLSVFDILLVTAVFYSIMLLMRGTQAVTLVRGVFIIVILVGVLSTVLQLRAFSWLIQNTLPALLLAIPIIFQPEIRRALGRLGRAGSLLELRLSTENHQATIDAIGKAAIKLSGIRHGALIVIEREVGLQEYIDTGIQLDATITPELITQLFYKDSPLHDGAVIIRNDRIAAAACIMPLSNDNSLTSRQLGLRHRAALGISEVSDAVCVIISEETGIISVVHNGRIIRRLDSARLANILEAFYRPQQSGAWWQRLLQRLRSGSVAGGAANSNRADSPPGSGPTS